MRLSTSARQQKGWRPLFWLRLTLGAISTRRSRKPDTSTTRCRLAPSASHVLRCPRLPSRECLNCLVCVRRIRTCKRARHRDRGPYSHGISRCRRSTLEHLTSLSPCTGNWLLFTFAATKQSRKLSVRQAQLGRCTLTFKKVTYNYMLNLDA